MVTLRLGQANTEDVELHIHDHDEYVKSFIDRRTAEHLDRTGRGRIVDQSFFVDLYLPFEHRNVVRYHTARSARLRIVEDISSSVSILIRRDIKRHFGFQVVHSPELDVWSLEHKRQAVSVYARDVTRKHKMDGLAARLTDASGNLSIRGSSKRRRYDEDDDKEYRPSPERG